MAAKKRIGTDFRKAHWTVNPMSPRLLPLKDAAQYLGFTVWAMREAIWAGLIPVVKLPNGRKLWVDRADLDKFIDRNKTTYE